MILEQIVIKEIKLVLSKAKGDGRDKAYQYYIYLVNKDAIVSRVSKFAVVLWSSIVSSEAKDVIKTKEEEARSVLLEKAILLEGVL